MKTVWLVHGIRQAPWREPHLALLEDTIKALPAFTWRVDQINYGYILIPITNTRAVNAIREVVREGDVIVAYSSGAWAAVQALELGTVVEALFLINPALHMGHQFPAGVKEVHVFYDEADEPTLWARAWRQITRILPWRWVKPHGWGAMGRYGYRGNDSRVTNHNFPGLPGHRSVREPLSMRFVAGLLWKRLRRLDDAEK